MDFTRFTNYHTQRCKILLIIFSTEHRSSYSTTATVYFFIYKFFQTFFESFKYFSHLLLVVHILWSRFFTSENHWVRRRMFLVFPICWCLKKWDQPQKINFAFWLSLGVWCGCPDFSSWMGLSVPTNHQPILSTISLPFLHSTISTCNNTPSAIFFLQTTTNTHQPFSSHPFFTDNHQHPPTLFQPSFFYRQPPTPTNPFIWTKKDGWRVGGCLYRQPPTPTNPFIYQKKDGWRVGGCLHRQPPTPTNPFLAILFLQTTTNTHQPFFRHPLFTNNHIFRLTKREFIRF